MIGIVLLPLGLGLLLGQPLAYVVWAVLVVAATVAQSLSDEVSFFVLVVVVLGMAGAVSVMAGVALRGVLRRRAATRAWRRSPERP